MSIHRLFGQVPCLLLALAAASCSQRAHQIGFDLQPSTRATVVVHGARPEVEVRNSGPGVVEARIEPSSAELAGVVYRMLRGSVVRQTFRGPVRVTLETGAEDPAQVAMQTRGADGFALDQRSVVPRE